MPVLVLILLVSWTGYRVWWTKGQMYALVLDLPDASLNVPYGRLKAAFFGLADISAVLLSVMGLSFAVGSFWARDARGSYGGYRWACYSAMLLLAIFWLWELAHVYLR